MLRRSLRAGLWIGLLFGFAWSLRRMLLLRRMATRVDVSRDPWTPLPQPDAEPPGPTPPAAAATAPPPNVVTTPPPPAPKAAVPQAAAPAKVAKAAKPAAKAPKPKAWVAPENGDCPPGHPIKAKTASHVFRVPGMSGYDQTRPDRCYRNEDEALADGFTRAKR